MTVEMNKLIFSYVTEQDISQIAEINSQHIDSTGSDGFLVVPLNESEIHLLINEDGINLFVAKDPHDFVLGYVVSSTKVDASIQGKLCWKSDMIRMKNKGILQNEVVYVKQLAVRREYLNQGVGTFLYSEIEKRMGLPLIAFVADKPRLNESSLRFHIKN